MKRTTREWVRKAESDFRLASVIARGSESFHDEQCFHCQQSAEKYLKALLAEWRIHNYLRERDEGAGFNYNSRQSRLHTAIELGETLWLFTGVKNPPRFYLAARLTVRAKTMNPPGCKYGDYRVWGDLQIS